MEVVENKKAFGTQKSKIEFISSGFPDPTGNTRKMRFGLASYDSADPAL